MGAIHVCFVDDLLMFCKVEMGSIRLLSQTFRKFSQVSVLQVNVDNSFLFLAGISDNLKKDILEDIGYCTKTFPFKYLGVPIASRKLSIVLCWPLVENITPRITCWFARLLTYTGRLQLIKAVTFGMQSYWARVFFIPKKMLKCIEAICKSYLWTGQAEISKKALVSWAKVCLPQVTGGLNVIHLILRNKAAITKHLWALAMKNVYLWIKCIHSFYINSRILNIFLYPRMFLG